MPQADGHIRITRAQGARFVEIMAAACPAKVAVARAVAAGLIGLVDVERGASFPPELRKPPKRPLLAIIGDDDFAATGPAGFPCAKRFSYWSRATMVHGAGAEAEHYALAVEATLALQQVLLVETSADFIAEWRRFLGDGKLAPILEVRPRNGQHPLLPDRGILQ
jgi:hypothetical protein